MSVTCLYHANCPDGITAAWVVRKAYPDAEFIPVYYGQDFPIHQILSGTKVFIVDFSYKRAVLENVSKLFDLQVIDHHKTAQEELRDLPYCLFDMEKSGAMLTWEYFYPKLAPPWFIPYVQDRDLWKWSLPNSRDINAYLGALGIDFRTLDDMVSCVPDSFVPLGAAITMYKRTVIDTHVRAAVPIEMDGYRGLAVNATTLFSEIAGQLAMSCDFGACWFIRADGRKQWSLRSRGTNVDVSKIAKNRGGGGHFNAAGFEGEP